MAITDELRAVAAKTECANGRCEKLYRGDLDCIADRIDAEHAALAAKSDRQREQLAAMEDALRRRNEGELKRRWQREIDALRDERDELREAVRLSEAKASDMVELPKDANGEYIRVGDVMKGEKIGGGFCEPFEVVGYIMSNGELEPMDEHKCPRKHKYLHHNKQPTVEDLLEQFAVEVERAGGVFDVADDVWTRFAAKLRLAESEGE